MNPYEILGINKSATQQDVDKAYRESAKKYHPDINPNNLEAEKKFKEIQSAYELVNKINKGNAYESMNFRSRRSKDKDFHFSMDDFFGNSVFKGRNIQIKIEIELVEVLSDCKKEVVLKKRKTCKECAGNGQADFVNCEQCQGNGYIYVYDPPLSIKKSCFSCSGLGRINIKKCSVCSGNGYDSYEDKKIEFSLPAGIEDGAHLIIAGEGEESLKGGAFGDAIIFVKVKESTLFKRDGSTINIEIPVSYTQLVLGCELTVPCLSGEKVLLKVPHGCQTQTRFRVKGKGLPKKGEIGDMIVNLRLEVPKEINEEYKKTLEDLSFLEKKYITSNRKQWNIHK